MLEGPGSPTPVVDVHAHAFPAPLLHYLERHGHADLSGLSSGVLVMSPEISGLAAGAPIPVLPPQYDMQVRLDQMDEMGVDLQAVSAAPFVFGTMSQDEALVREITRVSNDTLAEFVDGSGGRMVGLGTVPVGTAESAEEAVRGLDTLDFAGLTMGTFGHAAELDAPVNEDLWSVLDERQTFVLLHPSRASSPGRVADYHLLQLLGYPMETALAVSRLILSGVLDRHSLVVCLAHGGGCLPSVKGRLNLGWRRKTVAQGCLRPPGSYLEQFFFDTAVFDDRSLRHLVTDVSASHVLLGTDIPFHLADNEPLRTIAALGLDDAQHGAIAGLNALRLLDLPAPVLDLLGQTAHVASNLSPAVPMEG